MMKNENTVIFHNKAKICENIICIEILPFEYSDGKKTRLPRKRSKGYTLQIDTNSFFNYALDEIEHIYSQNKRYSIEILVCKGRDKLGSADLDNYAKAILDGITKTEKIWKDDKQVDKLLIERIYFEVEISNIKIKIKEVTPHNTQYTP